MFLCSFTNTAFLLFLDNCVCNNESIMLKDVGTELNAISCPEKIRVQHLEELFQETKCLWQL